MPDEYAPGRRLDRELKANARTMISKPFLAMGRTGKGIVPIVNYMGGGWLQGAVGIVRGCRGQWGAVGGCRGQWGEVRGCRGAGRGR